MLTFIGLGLYDKEDISEKGLRLIRNADHVFLEGYTSRLMGATREELEAFYHKPVRLLLRVDVEQHPARTARLCSSGKTRFFSVPVTRWSRLPMRIFRIRAADRGIPTAIIHGASIVSAVCGLSGLQNYRFGKSCSVPFPQAHWSPTSPMEVIAENRNLRPPYAGVPRHTGRALHDRERGYRPA